MNPPFVLKSGDTLGVCAPSACFDSGKLEKGIAILERQGFLVKVAPEIFDRKRYLAGEDLNRAEGVNRLFSDPDVKGIFTARGGFGVSRMLDFLDWEIIRQNPKPVVGFSDNTALLLSLAERTGIPVIHGPNVVSLPDAASETLESLFNTLSGLCKKIELTDPLCLRPGKCNGILKGGNLATIAHLAGTPYQPAFKGAVLFLEDIGEPAYKIDRMLTQMKLSGMLDQIKGVVTGSFADCDNDAYIPDILLDIFEEYHVPLVCGLAAGHGRVNLSLYMGSEIELDADAARIEWI